MHTYLQFYIYPSIQACGRSGEWQKSLELFREMQEKGLKPDVVSFNTAIDACARAKQYQKALDLLQLCQVTTDKQNGMGGVVYYYTG